MRNSISCEDVIIKLDQLLEQAESATPLITDKQIQLEQKSILAKNLQDIKKYKEQVIIKQEEGIANLFLYYQCAFNSKISHFEMCLNIKNEQHHAAWIYLIDMQDYYKYAIQAFKMSIFSSNDIIINRLLEYKQHIQSIEDVIFRKMPIYQSCGLKISGGKCSVCEKLIDTCTHIEECIYMGRVCKRIFDKNTFIELEHGALVTNPKDRRCIITKFTDKDGSEIDNITQKRVSKRKNLSKKNKFEGYLVYTKQLDIF